MLCWVMYCVIFQIIVIRSLLFCHSWREPTDHSTSRKKTGKPFLAGTKQIDTQRFSMAVFSPPSNLALGKRRHPTHQQVETNDHASHDPEALGIIRAVKSEQDGEYDAAEIAHGAYCAAEDTVGVRVDVWDEGEVGSADLDVSEDEDKRGQWKKVLPVTSLQEERHSSDQPEHRSFVLWIEEADGDQEGAGYDADEEDPAFLQPEVGGDVFVEEVADYAA